MEERHGRARRVDRDPRRRPGTGLQLPRRGRFERLVTAALAGLPPPLQRSLAQVRIEVAELPPRLELPVQLTSYLASASGTDRIVLHRRPLEARAGDAGELTTLIAHVVVAELAAQRGWTDRDLDELGW